MLTGNVASANLERGFFINGGSNLVLTGNVASANGSEGFFLNGNDLVLTGNAALGNVTGIYTFSSATITQNNLYGNDATNCGLVNDSGGPLDATNNFWGAATGPGPDPADDVCDVPNTNSTTLVTPFATQPFEILSEPPGGGGANGGPVCTAAHPVPNVLWPPNHQLVPVWIIGVTDPDNDPIAISITGVTQDEPLNGIGDGDVTPDAVVHGSSVDLRAERSGSGNGRVYQIQFTANDGKGGSCTGAVTVGVPKSQKPNQVIVDDGQVFNSTQP